MKMRLMTASFLLLAASAICCQAQEVSQPGQLTSNAALNLRPESSIGVAEVRKTEIASLESNHDRKVNHIWEASLLAVAASTSMDAATSWGKREGNALLASSDGTFGARGLSIKAGMLAAVVVPQYIFRHHQDLKVKFAIGNFVEAGIFAGVSVHNIGIAAPGK